MWKYVRDGWNIFDQAMLMLLAVAIILRCTLTSDADFMWARSVYAVDLVMYYLRILQLYLFHLTLGPIVVMFWRMVCCVVDVINVCNVYQRFLLVGGVA